MNYFTRWLYPALIICGIMVPTNHKIILIENIRLSAIQDVINPETWFLRETRFCGPVGFNIPW